MNIYTIPKLSILIASTWDRDGMTTKLLNHLTDMYKPNETTWRVLHSVTEIGVEHNSEVEINVLYDNKEMSIGAKRQRMIEEAEGEYVCFIDSDDWVPDYYIEELLKAIEQSPDCIGFEIECTGMKGGTKLASASNQWRKWETINRRKNDRRKYDFLRTIYHKTPVKREHALAAGFPDIRYGEDHEYSERLKKSGVLKKEVFIPKIMYIYQYNEEPFDQKYGFDKDKKDGLEQQ